MINNDLKIYIENNILPLYEMNDLAHNIEHINYVIRRSILFSCQFENINIDMIYTIAAFHDIGYHINKDRHEVISAQIFYNNEDMKEFFTDDERIIIRDAIIDHRASNMIEPRTVYGKIVSSADRTTSIDEILKRTHEYSIKYYPELNLDDEVNRSYLHIFEKYGYNGYAKNYCIDYEYEQFRKDIELLLKNKDEFIKRYMEVNESNYLRLNR